MSGRGVPNGVSTDDERRELSSGVRGACLIRCELQADLKSAILSAGKRARLKHNPSRVRFSEGVVIGTPPHTVSDARSLLLSPSDCASGSAPLTVSFRIRGAC